MNIHEDKRMSQLQVDGKMVDLSENLNILANYSLQKGEITFKNNY